MEHPHRYRNLRHQFLRYFQQIQYKIALFVLAIFLFVVVLLVAVKALLVLKVVLLVSVMVLMLVLVPVLVPLMVLETIQLTCLTLSFHDDEQNISMVHPLFSFSVFDF